MSVKIIPLASHFYILNLEKLPEGAQVGRFSTWGTVVPKGYLAESAYLSSLLVTQPRPHQRAQPCIRVNLCCTKEGPWAEQRLSTDKAILYK